jgi:dTMP kinase
MTTRGRFITIEGIDGAGKSSHLEHLCARVRARGHGALLTREPGGTTTGEKLREVVLHQPMTPVSEALVMFGARSLHVSGVIEPALASGTWVVCDRFSDSTYAYQCGGRGLKPQVAASLEGIVHPDLQPDATFLFDLDPAIAYERQRARSRTPDKFEREQAEFFVRVREAYLDRARQHKYRFHVIDASGSIEDVRTRLDAAFTRAFP